MLAMQYGSEWQLFLHLHMKPPIIPLITQVYVSHPVRQHHGGYGLPTASLNREMLHIFSGVYQRKQLQKASASAATSQPDSIV